MLIWVLSLCIGIGGDIVVFCYVGFLYEMVVVVEFDLLVVVVFVQKFFDIFNFGDVNVINNWKDYYGKVDFIIVGIFCQFYFVVGKQWGSKDVCDFSEWVCEIIVEVVL